MTLAIEISAFLVCFVYSSFFEWFGHRYFMHARRFPLASLFDAHTLFHHQKYKRERFQTHEPGRPSDVTLHVTSFPLMIVGHLPFFALIQWLTQLPVFWGAVAGASFYYAAYEYSHYFMHVPRGSRIEQFRWFQFLREHHRIHHSYMLCNFNVLLPLGDLCFGTLRTSTGPGTKPVRPRFRILSRKRETGSSAR